MFTIVKSRKFSSTLSEPAKELNVIKYIDSYDNDKLGGNRTFKSVSLMGIIKEKRKDNSEVNDIYEKNRKV
jgi:hypothetical protein